MRREQHGALEITNAVVDCGDGFQIEVVGRLVDDEHVRAEQHHARQHQANLLTAGQYANRLVNIVAGEQHTAEEAAQRGFQCIRAGIRCDPVEHVFLVALEELVVVLREIALRGGNAPLEAALIRFHLAHKNLEQRSHCQLVIRYERNLVTAAHDERYVVEHLLAVDGLGDAAHLENVLACLTVRVERYPRVTAGRSRHFLDGQLVDQLAAAGRLTGLGLVCRKTLNEVLQFLDLFLILAVLVLDHALNQLRGLIPELIVADVQLDLAVVNIDDVGTYVVQEVTVMRYNEDGALKIGKEVLQPADCLNIQMVGRLVQQQNIRLAEQCTRQQHLDLLNVTEVLHLGVQDGICIQTQTVQQLAGLGLGVPTAHFSKLGLQLGSPVAVLLGERVLHVERILFVHDLKQTLIAAENRVENSLLVEGKVVLLEYAHTGLGRNRNRAGGRVQIAGQNAQEGRLACTVCTDNTVAVALGKFQVYIFEQRLAAEV